MRIWPRAGRLIDFTRTKLARKSIMVDYTLDEELVVRDKCGYCVDGEMSEELIVDRSEERYSWNDVKP